MKKTLTGMLIVILMLPATFGIGCSDSEEQAKIEQKRQADEVMKKAMVVKPTKQVKVHNPFGGDNPSAPDQQKEQDNKTEGSKP